MVIPGKGCEIRRYRRALFWNYQKGASLFVTIAISRLAGRSPAIFTASRLTAAGTGGAAAGTGGAAAAGTGGVAGAACGGAAAAGSEDVASRLEVAECGQPSEDARAAPGQFGQVVDGKMVLNALGAIVAEALDSIPRYNPGVTVFGRVVMPDHVHFNVHLRAGLDQPLKVLGNAIGRFKNYTIRQSRILAGRNPALFSLLHWQQGYHDRLCLSTQFIEATERYIAYNPLKWQLMYQTRGALVVHEPLDSPRLDAASYWKGVGNVALLSPEEKIVALRISRRLSRAQVEAAVVRMEKAVDAGYIVLSGFISPGEKLVRDRLCARKDGQFIRILPHAIPNRRFKPESRYINAFLENRYLEIARGNEEVEFSRAVCLDYNAAIVEIAKAGQGLAVYFTPEGVVRLAGL